MDQPEIGDPRAKKGGTFNYYIANFPPTIRPFGPESNNSFRGDLYDYIEMAQVTLHPATGEMHPGAGQRVGDRAPTTARSIFRLDPEAKFNDGVPVKARDFMIARLPAGLRQRSPIRTPSSTSASSSRRWRSTTT